MNSLSVIVPVYNSERYLRQCIESILDQSYRDIELILVDDGSKDSSGSICDEYALNDIRVKVLHKENGGAVSAKKHGLKLSSSEYVTFVDSDDWIDKNMYKYLFTQLQVNNADIITSGFCMDGYEIYDFFDEGVYDRRQIEEYIFPNIVYNMTEWHGGIIGSACNKIYKKSLISEVLLNMDETLRQWEDTTYVYYPFFKANRIQITRKAFYHYRENDSSVTRKFDEYAWEKCKKSFAYIEKVWIGNSPQNVMEQLQYVKFWAYMNVIESAATLGNKMVLDGLVNDSEGRNLLAKVNTDVDRLDSKYKKVSDYIKNCNTAGVVYIINNYNKKDKFKSKLRNIKRRIKSR